MSIILSVGLSIFEIVTKEVAISGLGRESQIAFSAADDGAECAFFWEIKHPGIVALDGITPESAFVRQHNISCAGKLKFPNGFNVITNISNFKLNFGNDSCANISVDKSQANTTIIESRGYNIGCDTDSPLKVERAIRITLITNA